MKKTNKIFIAAFISFVLITVVDSSYVAQASHEYTSGGKRDPFIPLAGDIAACVTGGLSGIMSLEDVNLQGIVVAPDGAKSVIINGEIMKGGDSIGLFKVLSIGNNEVVVEINENIHTLRLYE